jgi:hypothetical protein
MKLTVFVVLLFAGIFAQAKGTGYSYSHLDSRLIDGKVCTITGSYLDRQTPGRVKTKRVAFVTGISFCRNEVAANLLAYVKSFGLDVYIGSGSLKDIRGTQTADLVYEKTGITNVSSIQIVDLTSYLQSAVSKASAVQ